MTPLEQEAYDVLSEVKECLTHKISHQRFTAMMGNVRDFLKHWDDKHYGYKSFNTGDTETKETL